MVPSLVAKSDVRKAVDLAFRLAEKMVALLVFVKARWKDW